MPDGVFNSLLNSHTGGGCLSLPCDRDIDGIQSEKRPDGVNDYRLLTSKY